MLQKEPPLENNLGPLHAKLPPRLRDVVQRLPTLGANTGRMIIGAYVLLAAAVTFLYAAWTAWLWRQAPEFPAATACLAFHALACVIAVLIERARRAASANGTDPGVPMSPARRMMRTGSRQTTIGFGVNAIVVILVIVGSLPVYLIAGYERLTRRWARRFRWDLEESDPRLAQMLRFRMLLGMHHCLTIPLAHADPDESQAQAGRELERDLLAIAQRLDWSVAFNATSGQRGDPAALNREMDDWTRKAKLLADTFGEAPNSQGSDHEEQ